MPTDRAPTTADPAFYAAAPDHLPRLDGLRALAVFGVLLFHAEYFQGGWVGVQIFFVLSGFLITRILLAAKIKSESGIAGSPSGSALNFFCRFYWRRTLRIFPLYFLFLLVLVVGYSVTHWPAHLPEASPWLFTYTFNFARAASDWPYTPAFGHLWSLAVEEQFYLLWPAAVWWLSARKLRGLIITMIVIAPLLRLGAGHLLASWTPGRPLAGVGVGIYNLLSSHIDAFGLGAGLAVGFPLLTRRPLAKLMACLFMLLTAGLFILHSLRNAGLTGWSSIGYPHGLAWHHQYVWGYTIINFGAAWFISLLVAPSSPSSPLRWLEKPLPAYLGRISYGIYIWHAPVLTLTASALHVTPFKPVGILGLTLATTASIALAAASFHCFESWFLKFKERRPWSSDHGHGLTTPHKGGIAS